jgi:hypothetical protein
MLVVARRMVVVLDKPEDVYRLGGTWSILLAFLSCAIERDLSYISKYSRNIQVVILEREICEDITRIFENSRYL